MEPIESNVLLGIAKKWNQELEAMPLQSQGTVISLLNSLMQHRKLNFEQQVHQKQVEAQERQQAWMEAQENKRQQDADIARAGITIAQ